MRVQSVLARRLRQAQRLAKASWLEAVGRAGSLGRRGARSLRAIFAWLAVQFAEEFR